ncbi:hypothetical protein LCGC14_2990580 [marine sediment metagenome]|uniref:Uncharacterized protein n=1 Tax=marine sediment metagenome TaxID=412755 RepID=A0A0F8ZV53_9ZZZZ
MSKRFIKTMRERHQLGVNASKEAKRQLEFAKDIGVDVAVQEEELSQLDERLNDISRAIKKQEE